MASSSNRTIFSTLSSGPGGWSLMVQFVKSGARLSCTMEPITAGARASTRKCRTLGFWKVR